jgi:hypothetical protein
VGNPFLNINLRTKEKPLNLPVKITEMIAEFEARSNQKVKAIYVGHKTAINLCDDLGCASYIAHRWLSKDTRLEFNGLPVFRVDADEHLNVG